MREKVGVKVVRALKRNNDGVSHAAIDMLCALMQVNSRCSGIMLLILQQLTNLWSSVVLLSFCQCFGMA